MSVSDDVSKFLDGDVIIDRRNPFKENDTSDNESFNAYCEAVLKNERDAVDNRVNKDATYHSPTRSLSVESGGNVALPVKHNITGNILNINENKEFQHLEVKQSAEDQELIQRFLREKDSDAYASLIKILNMDNETNKKKSLKKIIPSFFSKNSKHTRNKGNSNSSIATDDNEDDIQSASEINSSSSTLVSDGTSKKDLYQVGLVVSSTFKNKNPNNELYIIENNFPNDSVSIAVPQESVKPKINIEKPSRSRSLSPHRIQNKFIGKENKNFEICFEPQYTYVKPKSPVPSKTHNVVITKPTIHHQASPDKINVKGNNPQPLHNNETSDIDCEVELRQKNNISFDAKNAPHQNNIVTSSPIYNNQRSSNIYEHVDKKEADKFTREQKDRNLKNVEAFYWTQLTKMKMQQDQELYKHYVMSLSDIHNSMNNNFDKKQRQLREPWRCRSVSPNFNRNCTPVLNPIPRRMNTSMDGSLGNESFQRNTPVRNTIGSTSNIQSQRIAYYDMRNNNNLPKEAPAAYGNTLGIPVIKVTLDNPIYGMVQKKAPLAATKPPIFKRGSFYPEPVVETPQKQKRVSFGQNNSQTTKLQSVHENLTVGKIQQYSPGHNAQTQADTVRYGNKIYGTILQRNDDNLYATVKSNNMNKSTQFDNKQLYAGVNIKKKNSATNTDKTFNSQHLDVSNLSSIMMFSVDSESGSEAGEVQRIMQNASTPYKNNYEDWNPDGKNRGDGASQGEGGRGRVTRRDDPRRHTLGGDLLRSAPPHSALVRGMDIEHTLPRGYPPPSSAMLFDDDPGIMSEVETASTGFRRGGKQRSSLPVVRTPSKTLERPLGLVFLQYRSETKRALLPNEITSIDTVKALFVRSFPKQLTMEYLDSPLVKIYIHDSSKDMFYELEDLRSHLRDIRDRSVLRLFESADVSGGTFPGSLGTGAGLPPLPSGPSSWDQDQSYFSEPEFDSDYHHQHIHKSKNNAKAPAYYIGGTGPSTLPRGGSLIRAYSPATGPPLPGDRMKPITGSTGAPPKPLRAYGSAASVVRSVSEKGFPFTTIDGMRIPDQLYSLPADRIHNEGYMSSPERGSRGAYEEPYYTQYVGSTRGGMTPVIDEETGDPSMLDDQYSLYSVKIPPGPRSAMRPPPYDPTRLNAHSEDLQQRIRVEHMERQLANLTGLVQKALQAPVVTPAARGDFLPPSAHFRTASQGPVGVLKTSCSTTSLLESVDSFLRNERPPKLGKGRYHKSVSFEKSVSFSDEPPDMNSPKQHSPQHSADTKPPKPAIKSSTLPRMSSQERDRLKPVPPPKPKTLVGCPGMIMPPGQPMSIQSIEYQNYLKGLLKKCKELRMDMRNLRRLTLTQAHTMREMICDTFIKFRTATSGGGDFNFHEDSMRLARDEEIYKQEMLKLEADLCDLENTVEQLRGSVINRKARVNMVDVERMALVLSKSSKTVADLKVRFPSLHDGIKGMLGNEMEKVVREERFLKEEPERLEMALRRCKKLTGTLVTLKRLASVQEQRLPCDGGRVSPGLSIDDIHTHDSAAHSKVRGMGESGGMAHSVGGGDSSQRSENALDALLDELQTFARPPDSGPDGDLELEGEGEGERGLLRRLRGASSPEPSPAVIPRGQNVGKPPVPERNPELLQLAGRRAPPPPPPRTSSRSPLASPAAGHPQLSASNSSSCDSVDSQEGARARHDLLEQRHQELLRKQKALQEQYARLQQIQRGGNSLTVVPPQDLKKTGSESNLVTKLGLNMSPAAPMSGSLTHLARPQSQSSDQPPSEQSATVPSTTSKVYETDIL